MQIRLKPYHKNIYPVNSLLIKGESVQEWIAAICRLPVDLQQVETYPIPGVKANSLYGCVVFFGNNLLPKDPLNHQYLQFAENKLLLPERSVYLPAVDEEELQKLAPGKKILLHPVVGNVILNEPVNWKELLSFSDASFAEPRKPAAGVKIPGRVNAYTLELSDEKLINDLLNPPSEKEVMENLPFDMKKLMSGNKREMEKYLKYLESNPDKALDLALPLDMLGSFRGDHRGRFSFSGNWMQRIFSSNSNGNGSSGSQTGSYLFLAFAAISFFRILSGEFSCRNNYEDKLSSPVLIIKNQTVLDSHYSAIMGSKRAALMGRMATLSDKPGEISEKYRSELRRINESGKKIKDSLTVMYTSISKSKADSAVSIWKKTAADSVRKAVSKGDFKKLFNKAVALKREKLYLDYARHYGVIKDSSALFERYVPEKEPVKEPEKEVASGEKKSIGSVLLLTGVLIMLALFFVRWKAPHTEKGKISAGDRDISFAKNMVLFIILTGSIVYILKPLIEMYGFGFLTIGVCLVLILLLYRLFGRGLTILNSDNEK